MKTAWFAFAFAAAASANCIYQDAPAYWMRERTTGVKIVRDANGQREWQHRDRAHLCFTTPVADIADPQLRDAGYREAVALLSNSLPFEARKWNTAEVVQVRQQIAALVGRDFESAGEFTAWWQEHGAFLRWSEEKQLLVADAPAGPAASAEVELRPAMYWQYEAMRSLRDVTDDGASIRGLASPNEAGSPAEVRFVVAKSALADRAAKEEGYRRAVTALIDILALEELPAATARRTRAQLTRLTGRTFADARAWAGWWSARRVTARLDESGTQLIAE